MRAKIQIYNGCGYIGKEVPKQQEEPLLPIGVVKEDMTNDQLKKIQDKADKLGILMPTQYNRKLT